MINSEVIRIFREISDILEIKGDNPFRVRAYSRAARNISGLTLDLEQFIREGKLKTIPGIGDDLADKIKEFARSGRIRAHQALKKSIPNGVLELLKIPSVGPKTARLLYERLNITGVADLGVAIRKNRLRALPGIKEKTIKNISQGIELLENAGERMTLAEATLVASEFIEPLAEFAEIKRIMAAGSLRRQKETVRDIDILAVSRFTRMAMEAFVKLPRVKEVLAQGETKASIRTKDNLRVDLRLVDNASFGAALLYFTGSKDFNIKLRSFSQRQGLKINEYGVFKGSRRIAGHSEEGIFKLLGLSYIPPELREDRGEIELARKDELPDLINRGDLKGDLHLHSTWSDGESGIADLAAACRSKGYTYAAIADHSQGLRVAGGLGLADLKRKRREIDRINSRLKGFRVLSAAEVDIDSAGRLDYSDSVLQDFDIVVAAIHTGFKQSQKQLTRRITKACQNKNVHIIAHPTGRLWGRRDAYRIDLEEVFKVAQQTRTCLEINSFPQRLDLNDLNCRRAKEIGVSLAISTDAHTIGQLEAIQFGIAVARRGWLSKGDVINTLEVDDLLKVLKK